MAELEQYTDCKIVSCVCVCVRVAQHVHVSEVLLQTCLGGFHLLKSVA